MRPLSRRNERYRPDRADKLAGAAFTAYVVVDTYAMLEDSDGIGRADTHACAACLAFLLVDDHHDSYLNESASIRWEFEVCSSRQLLVRTGGSTVGYFPVKQASQ